MDTQQRLSTTEKSDCLFFKSEPRQSGQCYSAKLTFVSVLYIFFCFVFSICPLHANPNSSTLPIALSPADSKVLYGSVEAWQKRAHTWYKSEDIKARRRQMREMSRPLKQACYYCHTRRFKGYVESTYLISLQMMAISAEQDVSCKDCHIGQRALNELGAKSLIQWRYAVEQQKDCTDCHEAKGKFKRLTVEGKKSISILINDLRSQEYTYEISSQVTKDFLDRLVHLDKEVNGTFSSSQPQRETVPSASERKRIQAKDLGSKD